MAHCKTILNQLAAFFPRLDFEKPASRYHRGQKFRSFSRWSQFLAMLIAQLTKRKSLRDLVGNIITQGNRIYHLGMKPTSRSTLERVNDRQPYDIYKRRSSRFCNDARNEFQRISSSSKARSISWMQQPSSCAWPLFSGQPIDRPRVR